MVVAEDDEEPEEGAAEANDFADDDAEGYEDEADDGEEDAHDDGEFDEADEDDLNDEAVGDETDERAEDDSSEEDDASDTGADEEDDDALAPPIRRYKAESAWRGTGAMPHLVSLKSRSRAGILRVIRSYKSRLSRYSSRLLCASWILESSSLICARDFST